MLQKWQFETLCTSFVSNGSNRAAAGTSFYCLATSLCVVSSSFCRICSAMNLRGRKSFDWNSELQLSSFAKLRGSIIPKSYNDLAVKLPDTISHQHPQLDKNITQLIFDGGSWIGGRKKNQVMHVHRGEWKTLNFLRVLVFRKHTFFWFVVCLVFFLFCVKHVIYCKKRTA